MEERKRVEKQFHNHLRDVGLIEGDAGAEQRLKKRKFYSITHRSRLCVEQWLKQHCAGKSVMDYCCGSDGMSVILSTMGAAWVAGIDISDISVKNTKELCRGKNQEGRIETFVMDGENTGFKDSSFDILYEKGALHHLDLQKAYNEMARILKPSGKAICVEALGHNLLIQLYRKMTPQFRTPWEVNHILKKKDIDLARRFFRRVDVLGFFHLASIAAVPFRNMPAFLFILSSLEAFDSFLFRVPFLRWQAWQVIFVLSEPLKGSGTL